jgi:hypothetical protein
MRHAARRRGLTLTRSDLAKTASSDVATSFDVFLSHSFSDAEIIAGIKVRLEGEGGVASPKIVYRAESAKGPGEAVRQQSRDPLKARLSRPAPK